MTRPRQIRSLSARSRDMLSRPNAGFTSSPLFATEEVIGAMLLGPGREQEWRQIAPLLEARGLPKVDQTMGGRYVRAVVEFFDHLYGLDCGGDLPLAPDGTENFEKWRQRQKRHS